MGIGLIAAFLIKEPLRADQVMEIKAGETQQEGPVAGARWMR